MRDHGKMTTDSPVAHPELGDAVVYRGPRPVAGILAVAFLALFLGILVVGRSRTDEIAAAGLFWLWCAGLLAWRLRQSRAIIVGTQGFESHTGMFRTQRVLWRDVARLERESEGILVAQVCRPGRGQRSRTLREVVVRTAAPGIATERDESDPRDVEGAMFRELATYRSSTGAAAEVED